MPNRISRSVTPWTCGPTTGTAAVGKVPVVAAESGAMAGGKAGRTIERSRSASWRSADLQSICPDVTVARPSATVRSSSCTRSDRSASLDEAAVITVANLLMMTWIRGRAMSWQANAEPMTGPTRPATSRTTSVLSLADAPVAPASKPLNRKTVQRVVMKPPLGKVLASISHRRFLSKTHRQDGDCLFWAWHRY